MLPVQLISRTTKSRRKFYTQVQHQSFHTVWTGPIAVITGSTSEDVSRGDDVMTAIYRRRRIHANSRRCACRESSSRTRRKPRLLGGVPIEQPAARASRMKSATYAPLVIGKRALTGIADVQGFRRARCRWRWRLRPGQARVALRRYPSHLADASGSALRPSPCAQRCRVHRDGGRNDL
jgi:hypothetical protein